MTGFPLAYVAISALTLIMLQIAPAGDPSSAYSTWGWRIPFFIGGLLAAAFVCLFSRQVEESEIFEAEADEEPTRRSSSCSRATRSAASARCSC